MCWFKLLYCFHMHDRVYCNRANSKLKQLPIIRLACRLLLLSEDNRTCCMHRMMTLFIKKNITALKKKQASS